MASATISIVNSRLFDDIRDESKRLLPPLEGYQHYPLIPIEQATESLYHLIDALERRVWFSKQNSQEPTDALTQDESAVVFCVIVIMTIIYTFKIATIYSKI
jgi:hypothetical protein